MALTGSKKIMTERLGRLQEKSVVITAAGQGIGRASVIACVAEGASVIATDINPDSLDSLGKETGCRTEVLDVTDRSAIEAFVQKTGAVDVLFNCAGYVHNGTILECDQETWEKSFRINVDSQYYMCQTFLPLMLEAGGASIINMSSVGSSVKGIPNRFVYCATKAAVIGLTKALAADFVRQGIRCNAICPGTVETPSLEERLRALGNYEEAREAFVARQAQARIGTAEEIAALVVYLASDESGYTTGAIHIIDGGWIC